jgi:hypothetical protein
MAIDIKDSTFNVDPHKIPGTSDFYQVRAMGRRVIPEQFNELFVCSFSAATAKEKRDYRDLFAKVTAAASNQGHGIVTSGDAMALFSLYWHSIRVTAKEPMTIQKQAEVYCSIFVSAIEMCPISDDNIYE